MASRVKPHQGRSLLSLFPCCFKGSDQPEITRCHDNTTNVMSLEPTLPMPPPQELDIIFTELVVRTAFRHPLRFRSCCVLSAALCSVLGRAGPQRGAPS